MKGKEKGKEKSLISEVIWNENQKSVSEVYAVKKSMEEKHEVEIDIVDGLP